jgi:hypothetical protein
MRIYTYLENSLSRALPQGSSAEKKRIAKKQNKLQPKIYLTQGCISKRV